MNVEGALLLLRRQKYTEEAEYLEALHDEATVDAEFDMQEDSSPERLP